MNPAALEGAIRLLDRAVGPGDHRERDQRHREDRFRSNPQIEQMIDQPLVLDLDDLALPQAVPGVIYDGAARTATPDEFERVA